MADTTDRLMDKFPHVPERLSGLVDLAYNLWWSWHPEARVLFKQINQQAWKKSIHNPVKLTSGKPCRILCQSYFKS